MNAEYSSGRTCGKDFDFYKPRPEAEVFECSGWVLPDPPSKTILMPRCNIFTLESQHCAAFKVVQTASLPHVSRRRLRPVLADAAI